MKMKSVRLTVEIRDGIENAMIERRFKKKAKALVAKHAELASQIYNDAFTYNTRKKMDTLPKGFLPEKSSYQVKYGNGYTVFNFSGRTSSTEINKIYGYKQLDDLKRVKRFPYNKTGSALVVYQFGDKLFNKIHDLEVETSDLEDEIKEAKRALRVALTSVTTTNKLIELWPEVKPFVAKYSKRENQLPVLKTTDLNVIFDLPVQD